MSFDHDEMRAKIYRDELDKLRAIRRDLDDQMRAEFGDNWHTDRATLNEQETDAVLGEAICVLMWILGEMPAPSRRHRAVERHFTKESARKIRFKVPTS